MRAVLPNRRPHASFPLRHGGQEFTITVGFHPHSGALAEVFVAAAKPGSDIEALGRDAGILVSIALQHDTPLVTLQHAVTRDATGAPATLIGHVLDAIAEEAIHE